MRKLLKKASGIITAAALVLVVAPSALAWGPERPTYTNESPADHPVFNSIINGGPGDERDFVRIAEKGVGSYTSDLAIEAGKQYEVYIYYHNNASGTYNDVAHQRKGVARDVRLKANFPDYLAKGEVGEVWAEISATNADPKAVWDEAYVRAQEPMTLHFVTGSAKIYNDWGANGSVLSMDMFGTTGTFLGMDELNGVIWGCDEYSGYVTYTIQTQAVDAPVVPPSEEVPDALPETGPAEIFLAVALIIVVTAGIVYFVKTRKAVSKATRKAKGKK